ncbi:unnamed protein product [Peronospora farinosa]|uniref:SKP1 component POZ domain-containing protein n=1 Tax=Peronospora farinosa TaxID=134698 RepID=A0AAV0SZG8_9STRA|nr:unnamed protein product [Peronospora farinosa]CAI5711497.1 unnamed protein product [Peronospora farinosa]
MNGDDEKRSKRKLPVTITDQYDRELQPNEIETLTKRQSRLQLKCTDDTTFNVTYEQAMMSSTLWGLMQDASETKHKNGAKHHVIPIFDVPTESVQRALDYCSCLYKQQVDRVDLAMLEWEKKIVGLESKELCDLAKVASNLDIQPLVDLTCRSIAQIMSATSEADELRKKFGLEDPPDDIECSCELRSDMAGFDFDMFNSLDHDLSTEEYDLVEFDQPSVDELVSFINGSSSNVNTTSNQIKQHQVAIGAKKTCHRSGENLSDPGDSINSSVMASKKKRKKRKKKKSPYTLLQSDTQPECAMKSNSMGSNKTIQELSSSDEEKEEPDSTLTELSSSRNGKSTRQQTLEEKVRLARQNPSAVFKESQFEDDDDEDMAKVIKMFELNLESAYRDCGKKEKPRLNFAPREVFRSSTVRSSQFNYVQSRLSAT